MFYEFFEKYALHGCVGHIFTLSVQYFAIRIILRHFAAQMNLPVSDGFDMLEYLKNCTAMKTVNKLMLAAAMTVLLASCEKTVGGDSPSDAVSPVALDRVAAMLSALPLENEHLNEVHSAVSSSSGNGYDEEYTMSDLFASPGKGVGDTPTKASAVALSYSRPLRELIREHVRSSVFTKASTGGVSEYGTDAEAYLAALEKSDAQIYWPYSEDWDGKEAPVFTFDPDDGAEVNVGYRVVRDDEGNSRVEEIEVDEAYAREHPVWVVNRNSDCGFTSLEIMRREHPEWDNGGGALIVGGKRPGAALSLLNARAAESPSGAAELPEASRRPVPSDAPSVQDASKTGLKTLVLKEFTMKRNYDCWLAGGSEFFIKAGSVADFYASTEAELRLYTPQVTDFMIVVKRKQKGQALPFNTVIVSDWSEQLTHVAFMIVEDDGGSIEQWKCSAVVKIKSKSYGFDISLPFNSRDDIVWRGQLSRKYIDATSNLVGHFGDVDITFEVQEY